LRSSVFARATVRTKKYFLRRENVSECRRQRHGAEWLRWSAVDHKPDIYTIVWELHEVDLLELFHKFSDEVGGILGPEPKADQRANIS
jgi:hypothetical protein